MTHKKLSTNTRKCSTSASLSMPMPVPAARNPCVAPSLFRHAGAHRPTGGAVRQRAARWLQRELAEASSP